MKYPITLFFLLFFVSGQAVADVVLFTNGDRLTGEIVSMDDQQIVLATAVAGEITIDRSLVQELETAAAAVDEAADAGAAVAVEEALAAAPAEEPEPRNWESHVTFNSSFSKGNTESELIQLTADYTMTQDSHRYKSKINSRREEDNGVTTKELDRLDLGYNYLFTDRWFFAVNGQFERDPIAQIEHKYTISPALGYDFFNSEDVKLNVQLGGGYTSEETSSGDESGSLVDWRLEYKHAFPSLHLEAFHDHHIYRNFSGRENLVLNSQTGLRYNLTSGIHLNVQLNYDYDDKPVPGTEKDDLTFVFGAGVTL